MPCEQAPSPSSLLPCAAALAVALLGCANAEKLSPVTGFVEGELLLLKQNGGWCWFQDPRAIVHDGRILVGTTAGTIDESSKAGDIDVTSFDLATRTSLTFKLHEELQSDDHDSPSLLVLPDGRYLAMYTKHANDRLMRWRVSSRPGDASAWEPERTLTVSGPGGVTYSNTFVLSAEHGRVYNFFRAKDQNPFVMTAEASLFVPEFEHTGRLLRWDGTEETYADPAKVTGVTELTRPYVRYASLGVDTIHFATTEDHPAAYDNSIYHGYIRGGVVYDSFGAVVDGALADDEAASPVELTRVFEGDAHHVAWTTDIEIDASGHPYMAFSVQRDGAATRETKGAGGYDHRFYYARFDGTKWDVHEMARAGARLHAGQDDYTGLVALDPRDPDTVFISTDVDPVTGDPLVSIVDGERHHEIFKGRTRDRGASWEWTPITRDSTADNLRPVIPKWEWHTALLWLRGSYHTMHSYEQDVVGLIDP